MQAAWNCVVLPPWILPDHGYNLGNPGLLCEGYIFNRLMIVSGPWVGHMACP